MKRSNGEGTIFKRKDGRWCAAFYDDSPNPKRHFVYGRTQSEVKKKLKEKIANPGTETKLEKKDNLTILEDWMLYYLENYKKNEIKETTFHAYVNLYEKHIKNSNVGKTKLDKITSNQLQKYYNEKKEQGYNPKTIKHIFTLMNSTLNKGVQLKMIKENVNKSVILPKREAYQADVLSTSDVSKILKNGKEDELYPLVVLTLYTGLRKGEVMALKWDNIDFENQELSVEGSLCRVVKEKTPDGKTIYGYKILEPKTAKSRRVIPLLSTALEALEMQKRRQEVDKEKYALIYDDQNFVFAKCDGSYLNQRGFMDQYYAFLEHCGVPKVRFHDLRHTFASLLLESGESPKVIQELLGHSTITTTMDIYTHITKKGKVGAMQKLDLLLEQENTENG